MRKSAPDLSLTITVRNGRLLRAMRQAGHDSVASLARASGVSSGAIYEYLALKRAPVGADGEWKDAVLNLAHYLRALPEDLFPAPFLRRTLKTNTVERDMASRDFVALAAGGSAQSIAYDPERSAMLNEAHDAIQDVLAELPERDRAILSARFGLDSDPHTLEELARKHGVRRERIRQIEAKAMRKILIKPVLADKMARALKTLEEVEP